MKISKLLLLIFVLSLCVPTHAQKKSIAKGVKAALGKKTSLTGMAPAIQAGVLRVPPTIVGSALPAQTLPNAALNTAVERTVIAKATVPQATLKVPTVPSIPEIKPVGHYYPTWRQDLSKFFSKEELNAIENAFEATDEYWVAVQDEEATLDVREPDEWDYETRFLTTLKDSGVNLTKQQIRRLLKGGPGVGFSHYFTLRNTMTFVTITGHLPWLGMNVGPNNPLLTELQQAGDNQADELARELGLAREIEVSARWSDDVLIYQDLNGLLASQSRLNETVTKGPAVKVTSKSPKEWLNTIEPYVLTRGKWPFLSVEEEKQLISDIETSPNDPASIKLKELKELTNQKHPQGELKISYFFQQLARKLRNKK